MLYSLLTFTCDIFGLRFHIYKRYKRAKERELITQRAELDEGKQVIKEMNDQIERIRKEASTMKEDYNKSLIDLTDEKRALSSNSL